eukprot:8506829-Pyramimonas_sp.AAC.1
MPRARVFHLCLRAPTSRWQLAAGGRREPHLIAHCLAIALASQPAERSLTIWLRVDSRTGESRCLGNLQRGDARAMRLAEA